MVDKYSWVDIGSSYLMNDVSAAYLWGNLEKSDEINQDRLRIWNRYYAELKIFEEQDLIRLPTIPKHCIHNSHMFYLKVKNLDERTAILKYLLENNILSVFHYVPLHSSEAGLRFGQFSGDDEFTTNESERLIRLPMYYGIEDKQVSKIIDSVIKFF